MDFAGGVSDTGVPFDLMFCPAADGPRRESASLVETRFKHWAPPDSDGLCPIGCGFAYFAPGGYDLLVWHRSHGKERKAEVARWMAYRIIAAGWDCLRMEALWVIHCAMERVRAGRRRMKHARPRLMPEKQFDRMLAEASAWLRAGVADAEYRYWKTAGYRRA